MTVVQIDMPEERESQVTELAVSAKIRENYSGYYAGESAWRALGAQPKAQNIAKLCGAVPHDRLLEIGCGDGSIVQRLSDIKFGKDLFAIEISESAVEVTNARKIARLKECRLFDGYHIPYADGSFDLAVLSHVLEHVEYPRRLLYEASRVARHVFVEVPLEDTMRLSNDFAFDSVGHINFYSSKTIRRLIQSCDLDIVFQEITNIPLSVYRYQFRSTGIFKFAARELLLRLRPRLACQLFTYHCALLSRRRAVARP